jgi:hypothetical protein
LAISKALRRRQSRSAAAAIKTAMFVVPGIASLLLEYACEDQFPNAWAISAPAPHPE